MGYVAGEPPYTSPLNPSAFHGLRNFGIVYFLFNSVLLAVVVHRVAQRRNQKKLEAQQKEARDVTNESLRSLEIMLEEGRHQAEKSQEENSLYSDLSSEIHLPDGDESDNGQQNQAERHEDVEMILRQNASMLEEGRHHQAEKLHKENSLYSEFSSKKNRSGEGDKGKQNQAEGQEDVETILRQNPSQDMKAVEYVDDKSGKSHHFPSHKKYSCNWHEHRRRSVSRSMKRRCGVGSVRPSEQSKEEMEPEQWKWNPRNEQTDPVDEESSYRFCKYRHKYDNTPHPHHASLSSRDELRKKHHSSSKRHPCHHHHHKRYSHPKQWNHHEAYVVCVDDEEYNLRNENNHTFSPVTRVDILPRISEDWPSDESSI